MTFFYRCMHYIVNNCRHRRLHTFVKSPSEKPQHNVQNEGGGVKGFLNNAKKTVLLVAGGFPNQPTNSPTNQQSNQLTNQQTFTAIRNQTKINFTFHLFYVIFWMVMGCSFLSEGYLNLLNLIMLVLDFILRDLEWQH